MCYISWVWYISIVLFGSLMGLIVSSLAMRDVAAPLLPDEMMLLARISPQQSSKQNKIQNFLNNSNIAFIHK